MFATCAHAALAHAMQSTRATSGYGCVKGLRSEALYAAPHDGSRSPVHFKRNTVPEISGPSRGH